MPLTFRDLIDQGIVDALGNLFDQEDAARSLLITIGFPVHKLPSWGNPNIFWVLACQEIGKGLGRELTFDALVRAAAKEYPGAAALRDYAGPSSTAQQPNPGAGVVMLVSGFTTPSAVLDSVRHLARSWNPPAKVVEECENDAAVLFSIAVMTYEGGRAFADALRAEWKGRGQRLDVLVATDTHRERLVECVYKAVPSIPFGEAKKEGAAPTTGNTVTPPALTVGDMLVKGLINALAEVLGVGGAAELVLNQFGFPEHRIPAAADSPRAFWLTVCKEVGEGIITGDRRLERLLGAAYHRYPGNVVFAQFREYAPAGGVVAPPSAADRFDTGAVIRVAGGDAEQVLAAAGQVAAGRQPPVRLDPVMTGEAFVLFHAPEIEDFEAAFILAEAIRADLAGRGQRVRAYAATREMRDYMIDCVVSEGPDQTRFELRNVRGTTKVEDVARGVMDQYDPKMWGQDHQGTLGPSVVDHVKSDGTQNRLDPDTTLADFGVRDGDTLQVHPRSVAGPHPARENGVPPQ